MKCYKIFTFHVVKIQQSTGKSEVGHFTTEISTSDNVSGTQLVLLLGDGKVCITYYCKKCDD